MEITTRKSDCMVTLTIKEGSAQIQEEFIFNAPESIVESLISSALELQRLNGFSDATAVHALAVSFLNKSERAELLELLTITDDE